MALDATRLKNALSPDLESQIRSFLNLGATPYPDLTNFCNAIATSFANKVVAEITANAALNNAKFSGTFPGTVSGATCSTTITDQAVTGGIV